MKKITKKHVEIITPVKRRCDDCGQRITDHHFLCNKCWGKRAQRKYWGKRRGISKKFIKL